MQASSETEQTVVWCLKYTVAGAALSWLHCHDQLQDNLQPGQESGPAGSELQEAHQVSPESLLSALLAVTLQRLPDQGQPRLRLQPRGEDGVRPKSARPRPSVPGGEQPSFQIPRGLQTSRLQICQSQPGLF